jgi:hypothetical protein
MVEIEYDMHRISWGNWIQTKADLKVLGFGGWELCYLDDEVKDGKKTGIFKRVVQ